MFSRCSLEAVLGFLLINTSLLFMLPSFETCCNDNGGNQFCSKFASRFTTSAMFKLQYYINYIGFNL